MDSAVTRMEGPANPKRQCGDASLKKVPLCALSENNRQIPLGNLGSENYSSGLLLFCLYVV
jgi:hypothetical protein